MALHSVVLSTRSSLRDTAMTKSRWKQSVMNVMLAWIVTVLPVAEYQIDEADAQQGDGDRLEDAEDQLVPVGVKVGASVSNGLFHHGEDRAGFVAGAKYSRARVEIFLIHLRVTCEGRPDSHFFVPGDTVQHVLLVPLLGCEDDKVVARLIR